MDLAYWKNYFSSNSAHFGDIRWDQQDHLSPTEMALISSSLQQFQRGEQSEGKHLFSFAKTFPDPLYLETMRLFIREEQTHAFVLGKFMDQKGIPRIGKHWVDTVFRKLRKMADLENTIAVLITAEIIAKVYYKALADATKSALLKALCAQILRDEDQHILLQCYTLNTFYLKKGIPGRVFSKAWRRLLMIGTIFIVWMQHRRVLQAGAHSFSSFFLSTLLVFVEAERRTMEYQMPEAGSTMQNAAIPLA